MEFRRIFDSRVPPDPFDKWRSCYCDELFADVIEYAALDASKAVLEIGPGTGQATEPILKTGCAYLGIELGENFACAMASKYKAYPNFSIVGADFVTHDFGQQSFDMVYSAATIQWIPEALGFSKVYQLLKSGGTFAMMLTRTDCKSHNPALYAAIQKVYDAHFHPETEYTCRLTYENVTNYGFVDLECRHYHKTRQYSADDFIAWTMIQASHLTLPQPHRSKFIAGVGDAIASFGGSITLLDDIVLYLVKKR